MILEFTSVFHCFKQYVMTQAVIALKCQNFAKILGELTYVSLNLILLFAYIIFHAFLLSADFFFCYGPGTLTYIST